MDRTYQTNPVETVNYAYNDIYELTGVTGNQTNAYDYDNLGNREIADSASYTPNTVNQYSDVAGTTPTYDNNGNLTSDGTNTYTFDAENRLATASNTSHTSGYAYDAFNRRVSKTVDSTTTYFIYDGDNVVAEYDSAGGLDAEYVLSDNIDEVLTMKRGANTYYYNYDGLGSVTEITDATGVIAENYTYDAYGQPSVMNSTIDNPYMFTGRRWDEENGIYHYRARMYDAKMGRFLQRDPLGYYDSMNLYAYVRNNPISFVDPDGEQAMMGAPIITGGPNILVGGGVIFNPPATNPVIDLGTIDLGEAITGSITSLRSERLKRKKRSGHYCLSRGQERYIGDLFKGNGKKKEEKRGGHKPKKQSTGSKKRLKDKHNKRRPGFNEIKKGKPSWRPWNE